MLDILIGYYVIGWVIVFPKILRKDYPFSGNVYLWLTHQGKIFTWVEVLILSVVILPWFNLPLLLLKTLINLIRRNNRR